MRGRLTLTIANTPNCIGLVEGNKVCSLANPTRVRYCHIGALGTPEIAPAISTKIYAMFLSYVEIGDFVGADMAKKFLHMGYTLGLVGMQITLVGESGRRLRLVVEVKVAEWKVLPREKIREITKRRKVLKIFTRFGSWQERMLTI